MYTSQQIAEAKELLFIVNKCDFPKELQPIPFYTLAKSVTINKIKMQINEDQKDCVILYSMLLMLLRFSGLALKKSYATICLNDIFDYAKYLAENKL